MAPCLENEFNDGIIIPVGNNTISWATKHNCNNSKVRSTSKFLIIMSRHLENPAELQYVLHIVWKDGQLQRKYRRAEQFFPTCGLEDWPPLVPSEQRDDLGDVRKVKKSSVKYSRASIYFDCMHPAQLAVKIVCLRAVSILDVTQD
ncbi:hypothetical protein J6590_006071 [Homalodisca vitripennis]|nr:hypothetical protein J6590_006071 [Homalodisca vitripennis]